MVNMRWQSMLENSKPSQGEGFPLPESGWGAVVAWLAGPSWVYPDAARVSDAVVVTKSAGAGEASSYSTPRTDRDQVAIDEDISSYVMDAGVPAPPAGITWRMRHPQGLSEEQFWNGVHRAMSERCPAARLPRDTIECLSSVLQEFLSPWDPPSNTP